MAQANPDPAAHPYADLLQQAQHAAAQAYIPYSHYPVGAALLAEDGRVFTGCNIENASYPATICAERVALVKAVSEGVRSFRALAVVTRDGGTPCGVCRQMLSEFAPDLRIIMAKGQVHAANDTTVDNTADDSVTPAEVVFEMTLRQLLPAHFGSESLQPPV